ncbi:MAG TPA: hypothetical protein VFY71_18305 [Planctomycetota bacterium]|nr:hypothetical protein [Planctomycetota bacterium]
MEKSGGSDAQGRGEGRPETAQRTRKALDNALVFAAGAVALPTMLLAAWLFDDAQHTGLNLDVRHRVMLIGAAPALLAGAALGLLAWRRTSPASKQRQVRLGLAVGAAIGLWLFVSLGLEWANRHFDTSEPFNTVWEVVGITPSSKGGVTASIRLVGAEPAAVGTLTFSDDVAASIVPGGTHIVIARRSGALGWRHLEVADVVAVPGVDARAARTSAIESISTPKGPSVLPRMLAILAIVGAVAGLVAMKANRDRRALARRLGGLARRLGISGSHAGLDYRLSDGWLWLGTGSTSLLSVERRSGLEGVASWLYRAPCLGSGDPGFDEKFCVRASDRSAAATLLALPEARRLMDELLASQSRVLRWDERGLGVRVSRADAGRVPEALDRLVALRAIAIASAGAVVDDLSRKPRDVLLVPKIISVMLLLLLAIGFFRELLARLPSGLLQPILGEAAGYGVALTVLAVPAAIWLLRRRAAGARSVGVALFAVPIITLVVTLCSAIVLNWILDPSSDRAVPARFMGYVRNSPRFALSQGPIEDVSLPLPPAGTSELEGPCDIVLHLRDGAFGWLRVVGLEPVVGR